MEFMLSFVITWAIGLLPPILIRYKLAKRPLLSGEAIAACLGLLLFNVALFTVLGSQNRSHLVLVIIFFVSYAIMKSSAESKGAVNSVNRAITTKEYARRYGVREQRVIELINSGKLKGERRDDGWYVL